jgi:GTP pyrophosphokinase
MEKMMLSHKFQKALRYATELHATQTRKGTSIPYVTHLLSVSSLVVEHGGRETEAIGALLHDAIEDQPRGGRTRRKIGNRFGQAVLAIVEGCTDDVPGLDRGKESWRARKESYIAHLAHASSSTRLVSAADKLHNARSVLADLRVLGDELWSRFNGGKENSLWNFRALATGFGKASGSEGYKRLVAEFDRTVTEIERVARGA